MITDRLSRRYTARDRTIDAVKGVSMRVDAGEIVGFLGPNGAGKTTTLRMLTTLLRPTAGTASIAGYDLHTAPREIRKRIGYVAQSGGAAQECTVADELELQGRLYRLSKVHARRKAAELVERFELGGLERRRVRTLSGGQRRRLDIALGLVHSPDVVFLDEPSTGLDPQSRANLWEHIRALRDEQGVTVFLTTHYLDEADALAGRLLVIDHGEIVAEGSPDELKARVSGDGVTVGVDDADGSARAAATAVSGVDGVHELSIADGTLEFRVPRGDVAIPELIRAMDAAGVAMTSLHVHRPTLDDVFLTLTGRSLRDAEHSTEPAEQEGKEAEHAA
ncbi:ATP-binding cassette domain-containing protein [Haloechinothrix sp. YIM 98757]|uniref:ATP-binding cassette domain-containing protein n=1 Tax=Haloechinothrix aidingensis TaxID=2752311 RepID=A0A838A873_9PSEU|nr:ATP-binding cassette domain-containing protein [Haloechinothrix aidingensis]